jgi:hypothetical protein
MKHLNFLLVFVCAFGMAQIQTPQPSPSTKVEQVVGLTKVTFGIFSSCHEGKNNHGRTYSNGRALESGSK